MPGKVVPVEIFGDRWHSTSGDMDRDIRRETEINQVGKKFDWEPLEIVWGYELFDQLHADNKVRELFL